MDHIVVVGNGIAGITAARHVRKKSDCKITVISGETEHFFSRTALMYIFMGHMKYAHTKPYEDGFWKKNRIDLVHEWVVDFDFDQKELQMKSGETIKYDKLVLALGSKPNKFGWPGQDLKGVQGLYSYQDLETMEQNTQNVSSAVIVGGGLIGIEMAEMLHSRGIHVTYIVRETNFWDIVLPEGEAKLINRHILEHGVDLRLETELKEIMDDGSESVKSVITSKGEKIPCQFVGLTVGVSPNVGSIEGTSLEYDRGILVNNKLETNISDVYAIGDCAQLRKASEGRRPIEPVWYVGRMMGETLANTLTGNSTSYDPGLWFNSAKFFDIEYQTYGTVNPVRVDQECHFYWESQNGKICVNIAYRESNMNVLGVNVLGIRMRQTVWEGWILKSKKLDYVVSNLREANFDPEFFHQYDVEIQRAYNEEFPEYPIITRKRSLFEKILG